MLRSGENQRNRCRSQRAPRHQRRLACCVRKRVKLGAGQYGLTLTTEKMKNAVPIVGLPADRRIIGPHPFSAAGEKYILAVSRGAAALPVILPATADGLDVAAVLDCVDGLLFTGSPSNVAPHHYNGPASAEGTLHDPERDQLTLPLIRAALERGVPVLGLCRGFQEMNVAMGGSLHQRVDQVPGFIDHREDPSADLDTQYGPAHEVQLEDGGMLREIAGTDRVTVNSLHAQGVDRLADGLRIEARADDGLIEAFRVEAAPGFALAVQWHPEWRVQENPFSMALFKQFGDACRSYRSIRI